MCALVCIFVYCVWLICMWFCSIYIISNASVVMNSSKSYFYMHGIGRNDELFLIGNISNFSIAFLGIVSYPADRKDM